MAHFAKLGTDNVVITVHVVSNDIATTEQAGIDFLNKCKSRKYEWSVVPRYHLGFFGVMKSTRFECLGVGIPPPPQIEITGCVFSKIMSKMVQF